MNGNPNKMDYVHRLLRYLVNNLGVVFALYFASLFLGAYCFNLAEKIGFFNSLWWAMATALTVGYGDISPETVAGKVVGLFFAHFWIFGIAPLVIANIISKYIRSDHEFTHAEQEWMKEALVRIAQQQGVTLPPKPAETSHGDLPEESEANLAVPEEIRRRKDIGKHESVEVIGAEFSWTDTDGGDKPQSPPGGSSGSTSS